MKNFSVKKAVILAGGLGTRFLPATLVLAKELFPIADKPAIMYHLKNLADAGIKEVMIVGNTLKEESFKSFISPPKQYIERLKTDNKLSNLNEYYDLISRFDSISYINQEVGSDYYNQVNGGSDYRRGSSIAILACKNWANGEPFMTINGDDFCVNPASGEPTIEQKVIELYKKTGDYIITGKEMDRAVIYKYSAMVLSEKLSNDTYKISDIVEKPEKGKEPSNLMGFARYIYNADVFDRILTSKPRANGEFCITDIISDVAKEGKVSTYIFSGLFFDCGSMLGLQLAGNYLLLKDEGSRAQLKTEFEKLKNLFD